MPGTRHTPAGRVGAEGMGQGSEGGLQLEGSTEVAVCVCVFGALPMIPVMPVQGTEPRGHLLDQLFPRVVGHGGGCLAFKGLGEPHSPTSHPMGVELCLCGRTRGSPQMQTGSQGTGALRESTCGVPE